VEIEDNITEWKNRGKNGGIFQGKTALGSTKVDVVVVVIVVESSQRHIIIEDYRSDKYKSS